MANGGPSKSDLVAVALSRDSVQSREIVSRDQELRADLFAVDLIERAQASSVDQVHDAGVKLNLLLTKLEMGPWTSEEIR